MILLNMHYIQLIGGSMKTTIAIIFSCFLAISCAKRTETETIATETGETTTTTTTTEPMGTEGTTTTPAGTP